MIMVLVGVAYKKGELDARPNTSAVLCTLGLTQIRSELQRGVQLAYSSQYLAEYRL